MGPSTFTDVLLSGAYESGGTTRLWKSMNRNIKNKFACMEQCLTVALTSHNQVNLNFITTTIET